MGETSEDCGDPLALLDPKEELLSEIESLEDEEDDDKLDVQNINNKEPSHSPPVMTASQATDPTTSEVITSNNNGKFQIDTHIRTLYKNSVVRLYYECVCFVVVEFFDVAVVVTLARVFVKGHSCIDITKLTLPRVSTCPANNSQQSHKYEKCKFHFRSMSIN